MRNQFLTRYILFILFAVILSAAAGCQKTAPPQTASPHAKRYPLEGKVIAVDKAKKKATIAHEEIKGYMDAMTMDFPIRDEDVLNTLSKDAEIRAELIVDKDGYWLDNFAIIAPPDPNKPALPLKEDVVQTGREIPDFKLTNQDGKRISMKDFRGRALAITFIYTKCPISDYCILMSKNFSDFALQLQNKPELKDKMRLLSISFDPQTDTPEVLRTYGLGYLGKDAKPDFTFWQLATGSDKEIKDIADFFGLRYETDEKDKTQFNHSLRTIVIAPDGKVKKVFAGNEWTINELLTEMQTALS